VIISEHLNMKAGNPYDLIGLADDEDGSLIFVTDGLANARWGIPQGSAASTFVAEMMLALSLNQVPKIGNVFGFGDNSLLMSTNEMDAVSMKKTLCSALYAHPVGCLWPSIKLFSPGTPVDFLGHRLTPKKDGIHIEPKPRNVKIFEKRMADFLRDLKKPLPSIQKAIIVHEAKRYVRDWTSAFSLCEGISECRAGWMQRLAKHQ
jgi:hypothetical protein